MTYAFQTSAVQPLKFGNDLGQIKRIICCINFLNVCAWNEYAFCRLILCVRGIVNNVECKSLIVSNGFLVKRKWNGKVIDDYIVITGELYHITPHVTWHITSHIILHITSQRGTHHITLHHITSHITLRTRYTIIATLLRQNDVAMSFWRNNDASLRHVSMGHRPFYR